MASMPSTQVTSDLSLRNTQLCSSAASAGAVNSRGSPEAVDVSVRRIWTQTRTRSDAESTGAGRCGTRLLRWPAEQLPDFSGALFPWVRIKLQCSFLIWSFEWAACVGILREVSSDQGRTLQSCVSKSRSRWLEFPQRRLFCSVSRLSFVLSVGILVGTNPANTVIQ